MSEHRFSAPARLGAPLVVLVLVLLGLVAVAASPSARSGCAQLAASVATYASVDGAADVLPATADRGDGDAGTPWSALGCAVYVALIGVGLLWLALRRAGPAPGVLARPRSAAPLAGRRVPVDLSMLSILRV